MGDSSESEPQAGAPQSKEESGTAGESLADAARDEREVAAEHLREELGRVPGDQEIDEWLRRHTEGY